jgi:CheY-like chemotaxis protein
MKKEQNYSSGFDEETFHKLEIDSNQLTISISEINLNRLLEDILLSCEIEKKNLDKDKVDLILDKTLPDNNCTITSDEVRLRQILTNLTGNAMKFTDKGFIKTGYRIGNDQILFYVQDTGKGIAQKKKEIIFERFRQEEENYTRLYGGTGLGLSISKGLVELLGGKIWIVSELGEGSTFYFSLPFASWTGHKKQAPAVSTPSSEYDFSGKTIVVEEDIYSNFRLINYMLSKTNATVLYAENGKKAVEFCQAEPHIDLILMDIQMPVMDGYEATAEIKTFLPDLPIIALTAYSFADDSTNCLEAGCADYLTKPIDKAILLEKVMKYLYM